MRVNEEYQINKSGLVEARVEGGHGPYDVDWWTWTVDVDGTRGLVKPHPQV
jgi:hypothetical protein